MVQSPLPQNVAVVLRIGAGSFADGFSVTLQILEDGQIIEEDQTCPRLPAAPEIPQWYQEWKAAYESLGVQLVSCQIQAVPSQMTHEANLDSCLSITTELEERLKDWFSNSAFRTLRDRIKANVRVRDDCSIPIIIDCHTGAIEQDVLLRKLPWHLWDLFDRLNNAEVALMTRFNHPVSALKKPIRVLAIFGSSEGGLQLNEDRKALEQQQKYGAEIVLEVQPTRERLHQRLYDQSWDILFFAGHSFSENGCQSGYLQIQDGASGSLPVNALSVDLKKAVERGLKLAIFNSCDGLGIADFLANLKVPTTIVMREPVPDRVARNFLRYFLDEFFQGKPLCLAVHEARNRLHWMESDTFPYPAASWLPIVCKNPNQPELVFPPEPERIVPSKHQPGWKNRLIVAGVAVLGVAAVVLVVNTPAPQPTPPSPTTYRTFAEVPNVPKGEFKYGGSTTWESVREKAEKAIRKAKPEFQLQHVGSTEGILDSSAGIKKLLQGEFTFSLSSRTLTPNIELQAQKQGINLQDYAVAINPIAVAVNPKLDISGLTVDRLNAIYARKVTNWKEVGGPDLPIQIIDRPSSSKVTVEKLTGDGDPEESSNILFVKTPTEALRKVAEIPGGIYASSSVAQVVPQCNVKALPLGSKPGEFISPYKEPIVPPSACPERRNQPNTQAFQNGEYPLTSKLYAIVKQNGGIEQQAGEAYVNFLLSDEGQKLLEEAGFARIR